VIARRIRAALLSSLSLTMSLGTAVAARAQTEVPPSALAQPGTTAPRTVEGRVLHPDRERGDSTGMAPTPNTWVTLHRVGKDDAGPVDSMRTDAQGVYRFRFTPRGAADAVYFASVNWSGIAYFTPPIRGEHTTGDAAEITVFDTTTRTFPLMVRGRHLIVGAVDSASERTVIEVFELSNDSVRALVSPEGQSAAATWSVAVPLAAREGRMSDGDVSPEAFKFEPGRASVFAPIAPGLKQISFSYRVPAASFPIAFTSEDGAVVFEVLLEEPQGMVRGEAFTLVDPVALEGRNFRRFLAQDVRPGARVIVELPTSRGLGRNMYVAALLVAIGFLMLLVLSRAMSRRRPASATETLAARREYSASRAGAAPLHERLASEIAALDTMYASQQSPSESVRVAYESRRAELVAALTDALAEQPAGR
jgi:hypothetical protein